MPNKPAFQTTKSSFRKYQYIDVMVTHNVAIRLGVYRRRAAEVRKTPAPTPTAFVTVADTMEE